MRALRELAGVITASVFAFFGGIGLAVALVFLWICGVIGGLFLMVALFAGLMFGITGKAHDGQIALMYLAYATGLFVLTFVAGYYQSKFGHRPRRLAA